MTHEELTIRIIKLSEDNDENWKFYPALRAVVELHKPCNCDVSHCDYCTDLGDMFSNQPYPCPTIQAIEKEL